MPDKTPVQIYREAADLIEKDGWVQGVYRNADGWCLSGAVAQVAGAKVGPLGISPWRLDESLGDFFENLRDLECCLLPPDEMFHNIATWNDAPGRRAQEVITLLRDRADLMEAEHA